jgi:signal transduction histidine kinase
MSPRNQPMAPHTKGLSTAISTSGRASSLLSRHSSSLLLLFVFLVVVVVGIFVSRDLRSADAEAQKMYAGSVLGMRRIGNMEYEAQETRRSTFYALSTKDSNLQVKYADQSREADALVTAGISEYLREERTPVELRVGTRLQQSWYAYLQVRDEVLASILEGSIQEAVDRDLKSGVPLFDRVREDLEEINRLYDEQAFQRLANVAATSRRTMLRLAGILGTTLVLAFVSVWAIQTSRVQAALQLAKLQMEFVASVSHELRTPLAVISSAADNIADGLIEGREDQQKYGRAIQNQSHQMAELVNQILLFAAANDRKIPYVLRVLRVSELVDAVLLSTADRVKHSGFTLDLEVAPDLPSVMGDLSALTQCLQNLVGNALKYSGGSRWIAITVSTARSERGGPTEILIAVKDRGIGIARSELPRVFEPFYRSATVISEQIHGTGLGLSVSKGIAESMGGRLTVASELGVGSTFTLHLPVASPDNLPPQVVDSASEVRAQQ